MFLMASVAGLVTYYTIGAIYFYCINNFYAATPVSWSVVVVEYCLITIAPDFILCVLATAFSLKLRPVFLGMMHEYSMVGKWCNMAYFPMFGAFKVTISCAWWSAEGWWHTGK